MGEGRGAEARRGGSRFARVNVCTTDIAAAWTTTGCTHLTEYLGPLCSALRGKQFAIATASQPTKSALRKSHVEEAIESNATQVTIQQFSKPYTLPPNIYLACG